MLTSEARALMQAEAFVSGCAVRATGFRHVRLDDDARLLVPLSLAGEDGALLAFAMGHRGTFELHVCPEPRSRDLAWDLLKSLATALCDWLDPLAADTERVDLSGTWSEEVARVAPQLVVPTPASVTLLRPLAERMSWRGDRSDPVLSRAGGWLMFMCDRHEVAPGDSTLVVVTEALQDHFVAPISAAESAHLLALVAALAPPVGMTPFEAAQVAELEPGSTLTTPTFDRDHLAPAIELFNRARREGDAVAQAAAARSIEDMLRPVLHRLVEASRTGLDLLRAIDPIAPLSDRRLLAERRAFTRHAGYLDSSGFFSRKDSLKRGLFLVDDAEEELERVTYESRVHDPVVRAVAGLAGEAFDGRVDAIRIVSLRPRVKRLQLEVLVPGTWRPAVENYDLVGTSYGFEIMDYRQEGPVTRVSVQASKGVRDAQRLLAPSLTRGDALGFVSAREEFPRMSLPEILPWMLNKGGT